MIRRKGEITCGDLKRNWPHHVALPAEKGAGASRTVRWYFALPPRYRRSRSRTPCSDFVVFCFAKQEVAEAFAEQWGSLAENRRCPSALFRTQVQNVRPRRRTRPIDAACDLASK